MKTGLENSSDVLKDVIEKHASGELTYNRIAFEAIVMEIDDKGQQFTEDNPVDTIRARTITDSRDRFAKDSDLTLAWPWLGIHNRPPLKIGERVRLIYPHPGSLHAYWLPSRHSLDNVNFKAWNDISEPDDGGAPAAFGDGDNDPEADSTNLSDVTQQKDEEKIGQDPHVVKQDVPPFHKSHDEYALEGSNNSLVRLGRDRPDEIGSGHDDGCVDIVAGRQGEDLSWDDAARQYTSARSDIDSHLKNPAGISEKKSSVCAESADTIRLRAHKNVVIWLDDGIYISINDGKVSIGGTKGPKKGQLVTEESVCRHKCPFLAWARLEPKPFIGPTTGDFSVPISIFLTPHLAEWGDGIVDSKFSASGGDPDHTESNASVEIADD